MSEQAKAGDTVQINYTGKLTDDSVFDTTHGREPFQFELGADQVIPGFDAGVTGMIIGEKRTITITSEDAYGASNPELMISVETNRMPEGVKQGDVLSDGGEPPRNWRVHALDDTTATLDGNHPLAGEALIFELELLAVV